MKKKVLWLVPKLPYPPSDGARYATFALLKGLAGQMKFGSAIDLIAVVDSYLGNDVEFVKGALGLSSVTCVPRSRLSSSLFVKCVRYFISSIGGSSLPVTVSSYSSEQFARAVQQATTESPGDTVLVYDGLHVAAHSTKGGVYFRPPKVARLIYRAHNCESQIWQRLADRCSNFLLRSVIERQAEAVRRFESSVLRSVDEVAAVSSVDLVSLRELVPELLGTVVPIGFEFSKPLSWRHNQSCNLLFAGRLDWPPNREGLRWFLNEVWPKAIAHRKSLQLVIAGSGDGRWLTSFRKLPGVTVLGYCHDLESLYQNAHLCIVPVFFGSGTRVKVLEAARWGRPCLSTAVGVEGTGLVNGQSYLRAETATDWINSLVAFDQNGDAIEIGTEAFNLLKTDFSMESAASRFMVILNR